MDKQRIKICVIVISYNRPQMIREALSSIRGADEVIISDDGSNFDLAELLKEFKFKEFSVIGAPPVLSQVRATVPRMGKLINKAVKSSKSELITYICDDDLIAENWLEIAKDFLLNNKEYHVVKGMSKNVKDINDLDNTEETRMDERQLVTGNFVHRKICFIDEGIRWPEDRIINADHEFLTIMHNIHPMRKIPLINKMACYRRIHSGNLSNYIGENFSAEKVKEMLNRKWMEY